MDVTKERCAGQTCVEMVWGQTGPTKREVMWVPKNGGAAEGFDVEALVERFEGVGGFEGGEVRA